MSDFEFLPAFIQADVRDPNDPDPKWAIKHVDLGYLEQLSIQGQTILGCRWSKEAKKAFRIGTEQDARSLSIALTKAVAGMLQVVPAARAGNKEVWFGSKKVPNR